MNILIVGGGTAGHLTPGMALYDEAKKRGHNVRFIISTKDTAIVSKEQYDYDTLNLSSPINIKRKLIFMLQFILAFFISVHSILKYKADFLIGMGGYVSLPPLIAAIIMGKKIYLCEQNSIPGKVNKLLHKYAKSIYVTFSKTLEFFPNAKAFGNPVRSTFFSIDQEAARKKLIISKKDKMLVVTGGSQGAKKLNEIVFETLDLIYNNDNKSDNTNDMSNLKVCWLCGRAWYENCTNQISTKSYKNNIKIIDFTNDMPYILAASDFVISRAGSSSISELIALNLPSLLIPFPYAAENHQYYNAKELSDVGAADLIEEVELSSKVLAEIILQNMNDNSKLQTMKEKMKTLNMDNATGQILNDIFSQADA